DNSLFVGADNGKVACLDTRDGTEKWTYTASGAVETTPALYSNRIIVGSDDGTVYVLNKYSGKEAWEYEPGYYLFDSAFKSSPIAYGNMVYIGGNDGYLYSMNVDKKSGPISDFAYYLVGVFIVLVAALIVVRKLIGRRKK
ncbi:MAG: PQQ-like beta-propeller repeat protein, partial [Methanobacterium paludis]|nr:PQQ-like beta-propeller repeat protein [Methanobacterium paludis]